MDDNDSSAGGSETTSSNSFAQKLFDYNENDIPKLKGSGNSSKNKAMIGMIKDLMKERWEEDVEIEKHRRRTKELYKAAK